MIKKIGSNPPSKVTETKASGVDSIKSAKVDGVTNVDQTNNVGKFRASTREITPELKKQLLQMIEDEAEKILAGDGISEKRRKKVKSALKMAIESGNTTDEEK